MRLYCGRAVRFRDCSGYIDENRRIAGQAFSSARASARQLRRRWKPPRQLFRVAPLRDMEMSEAAIDAVHSGIINRRQHQSAASTILYFGGCAGTTEPHRGGISLLFGAPLATLRLIGRAGRMDILLAKRS